MRLLLNVQIISNKIKSNPNLDTLNLMMQGEERSSQLI